MSDQKPSLLEFCQKLVAVCDEISQKEGRSPLSQCEMIDFYSKSLTMYYEDDIEEENDDGDDDGDGDGDGDGGSWLGFPWYC